MACVLFLGIAHKEGKVSRFQVLAFHRQSPSRAPKNNKAVPIKGRHSYSYSSIRT